MKARGLVDLRPRWSETAVALLCACVLLLVVLALYRPVLGFELQSDDYLWVQRAHAALDTPRLLVAEMGSFFRPISTWTLALDWLVWGFHPFGYYLTSLLLQWGAAVGLVLAGRRLGLGWVLALATGLVWAVSPFAFETASSVSSRPETPLLIGWLGLALVWPGAGGRWSRKRLVVAGAATVLAMASKETWLMTPALVLALEWGWRRTPFRDVWRPCGVLAVPMVIYVALYAALLYGTRPIFEPNLALLAKVPHQLAAFGGLETLRPADFRLTTAGVLATLVVTAAGWHAVRRREAVGSLGLALLVPPMIPTLMMPFLPLRYTVIPFAGFLLLAAGSLASLAAVVPAAARRVVSASAGALVLVVLARGVMTVQGNLRDYGRVNELHVRLLAEARAVIHELPRGVPVVVLRGERESPLARIAETAEGTPKAFYIRPPDAYGLVNTAALLEWVLADDRIFVREVHCGREPGAARPGAVLLHRVGGFRMVERDVPSPCRRAADLEARGAWLRVIEVSQ